MKHSKRNRSQSPHSGHSRKKKHHRRDHEAEGESFNSDGEEESHSKRRKKEKSRHRDHSDKYNPNIRIKQERDERTFQRQEEVRSLYNDRRREHRRARDREGGDHGLNTQTEIKEEDAEKGAPVQEKQQPNFGLSGKLTEDTNTFRGVVIKYNEPQEAMKPKRRWRLYPFKGETSLPVLHIHRQSAFLLGRDRRIADIPVDHPSCSKQQAVLQFRAMAYTRDDGSSGRRVRPYIIDLESANGTYLNGERIEAKKYYELREKDVLKFGFSTREYVVLHDSVDTSELNEGEDMEEA